MKTCCAGLNNLIESAGNKGFGVLPMKEDGVRRFVLQARPLDERGVEAVKSVEFTGAVGLALAMDLPLRHCPSCGARLENLVESQVEEFDRAADAVRRHVIPRT